MVIKFVFILLIMEITILHIQYTFMNGSPMVQETLGLNTEVDSLPMRNLMIILKTSSKLKSHYNEMFLILW